jgi:hypothetical protein
MFTALYFKEWREKVLVFTFELSILAVLLGAQLFLQQKKDIREWLVYAVLLLFFPFAALILGAAGFEAEYRQEAWAYLFSRPVSRPVVWLTKLAALASMFTVLWIVFLAAWAAFPAVRELASGPRVLLEYVAESGFPWWSVGLSAFLLIVAFSLSLLRARQFNLLFVALLLGLVLPAAAWGLIISKVGGFMAWLAPEKALRTLLISLVLMALAFVGASLLTLVRADHSQPRRQMRSFAGSLVLFLVLALAGTVATALFIPLPGHHFVSLATFSGDKAVYVTERGMLAYDAVAGRIRWLAKTRSELYQLSSPANGRIAYSVLDIKSRRDVAQEVWTVGMDGRDRRLAVGRGSPSPWDPANTDIMGLMIRPEGRSLAILTRAASSRSKGALPALWTVNVDGTGLERLPLDALLADGTTENLWLFLTAWGRTGNVLLILKRHNPQPGRSQFGLWAYDLDRRTLNKLEDGILPASWRGPMSPREDLLAIKLSSGAGLGLPATALAFIDLATMKRTAIVEGTDLVLSRVQWDPAGERLLFQVKRPAPEGRTDYAMAVYSLAAGKVVAEESFAASEREAWLMWTAWMPDGRSIVVLDPERRSLKFLSPELKETGRIVLPARLHEPGQPAVVGDQVLVVDGKTDSLWRLDLDTKRWKRIY